jgi:CRISPR-associated protein Cpf1
MTGFVNLFDMKKAKEDTRSFFSNFKSIVFEDGFYKFTFDYENFNTVQTDYRKIWTVCSYGRRITTVKEKQINKNGYEVIDLTEALKDFFKVNGLTTISLGNILEKDDKAFFDQLFYYFKLILQMRNSTPQNSDNEKCIDYLVSPVMYDTKNKLFFHSDDSEISDADANGAYHIALKGLYWLMNDFPTEKKGYLRPLRTDEWLRFAQEKPYINNK